jgi:hypothetical protein
MRSTGCRSHGGCAQMRQRLLRMSSRSKGWDVVIDATGAASGRWRYCTASGAPSASWPPGAIDGVALLGDPLSLEEFPEGSTGCAPAKG